MKRGKATLDRTRDFGQTYGADYAFEQDGKFFDGAGNEVIFDDQPAAAPADDAPASGGPEDDPDGTDRKTLVGRYAEVYESQHGEPKGPPRSWNKGKIAAGIKKLLAEAAE